MKIMEIIKEYREMRKQVKLLSRYYNKDEITEMLKYCNDVIYRGE